MVLLQRLSGTLATSSNQNSLELALLAVRNHVNDAILHAQLHGPRITTLVSKIRLGSNMFFALFYLFFVSTLYI